MKPVPLVVPPFAAEGSRPIVYGVFFEQATVTEPLFAVTLVAVEACEPKSRSVVDTTEQVLRHPQSDYTRTLIDAHIGIHAPVGMIAG